jgi:hypothetical protein
VSDTVNPPYPFARWMRIPLIVTDDSGIVTDGLNRPGTARFEL